LAPTEKNGVSLGAKRESGIGPQDIHNRPTCQTLGLRLFFMGADHRLAATLAYGQAMIWPHEELTHA